MNIGIIGFGIMGQALVSGMKRKYSRFSIGVIEKSPEKVKIAEKKFKAVDYTADPGGLFENSDAVVLAIKPQDFDSVAERIKQYSRNKQIVSIIAGKKIDLISKSLDTPDVARIMPNLAACYGKAYSGVAFNPKLVNDDFRSKVLWVAEPLGSYIEIPERLMPAITGLSGSGIAFVFHFIHAMALGGTKAGISYPDSLAITMQVVEGALREIKETGENPAQLTTRVTSPAGTTIEGISTLEEHAFTAGVIEAVMAATSRAAELEH